MPSEELTGATMRGLRLGEAGLELRRDLPWPRPSAGECRLEVRLAGICATDLELVKGYAGFSGVLGHEFVARVADDADATWAGRRVVASINCGCRTCPECVGRGPEHCPRRTVIGIVGHDGAFAEALCAPLANLLEVPDELADEHAVFVEPLAAAVRIREQIRRSPSDRVAVVGPGRLGLLIAQVLGLDGSRVTVLGRRAASLELPARWGFETGLAVEAPADAFDVVVEATGNEDGLAQSLRIVRPRGTLVLKSTFHGAATVDLTKLVVGELRVVGSRCGPFAAALRLLERGAIEVEPLIEARYELDDGLQAMQHAVRPGALKILLRP